MGETYKGYRGDSARCQTCQTYGSRINPLFEIAVDDNEGIFECADCLHTARVLQDQGEDEDAKR